MKVDILATLLITIIGVLLTVFLLDLRAYIHFSCPELITEIQIDSLEKSLTAKKHSADTIQKVYAYHHGVIVKLNSKVLTLKRQIRLLEEQIKDANERGESTEKLKKELLGKRKEYNRSMDLLAKKARQNACEIKKRPSIRDSLEGVLKLEEERYDSLYGKFLEYKKYCHE